jgi:hypothetical protein
MRIYWYRNQWSKVYPFIIYSSCLTMFGRFSRRVFSTATPASGERLQSLNHGTKDQFGFGVFGGAAMLLIAGGWFVLNSHLGSMDKKIELLRSDLKEISRESNQRIQEISRESNQRILALEVDKGVREAMEKERRRHGRRPHGDQGQDLSRSK